MFEFFGQFDSMEDLESRMVNTFSESPERWIKVLAHRIIVDEMKVVKNPAGGITVFWHNGSFNENYKWN